jgi:hypothetical protein
MAINTFHGAHDQKPELDKLKQLALYIASRSEDDPKFGRVKFNKLLFYADFIHYVKTGRSITGFAYIKMEFGPCPEGFNEIESEMDKANELKLKQSMYEGFVQRRPIALVMPDLSGFSGEEIATVEEAIGNMWRLNGREASNLSHLFVGWRLAKEFEKIPYSVARLGFEDGISSYHFDLAQEVASRVIARLESAS